MQNYMPNSQISYNKNNVAQAAMPQQVLTQQNSMPAYQTQPTQNPNYAGVNIQIFNPMVNPNGGNIYPQQTNSAYNSGTQGGCYPSNYYTTQPGVIYNPYPHQNNTQNGFYDSNGKYYPYVKDQNGQLGYYDDKGEFHPLNSNNNGGAETANNKTGAGSDKLENADNKTGTENVNNKTETGAAESAGDNKTEEKKSDESKEIEKPLEEENKNTDTSKEKEASSGGKTEKKKVVELSDDYIKTLENYLNSQDVEVRKMGAHEVVNRLSEDKSRNDDPALTALVNKMLQDPSTAIRTIALSLVESRSILGDDLTVNLLKKMQNSKDGFGLDANQATSALLKMAGKTVEKEVPVEETKKDDKSDKDKSEK